MYKIIVIFLLVKRIAKKKKTYIFDLYIKIKFRVERIIFDINFILAISASNLRPERKNCIILYLFFV